ncbi:33387_t:CDS:2, partial [Gigaspora margarita]
EKLKKEMLAVMGHQILEVIVIHHIQDEKTEWFNNQESIKLQLGYHWATNRIQLYCKFGTCTLEIFNTPQVKNDSDTGTATS